MESIPPGDRMDRVIGRPDKESIVLESHQSSTVPSRNELTRSGDTGSWRMSPNQAAISFSASYIVKSHTLS